MTMTIRILREDFAAGSPAGIFCTILSSSFVVTFLAEGENTFVIVVVVAVRAGICTRAPRPQFSGIVHKVLLTIGALFRVIQFVLDQIHGKVRLVHGPEVKQVLMITAIRFVAIFHPTWTLLSSAKSILVGPLLVACLCWQRSSVLLAGSLGWLLGL
jgi:hypothetical protein